MTIQINQIQINPINLIDEKGWTSWDDVENEIERIREEFNLIDSTSIWDEAHFKFIEIYLVNPIDLKSHLNN
jgi:hypothetical protein